MPAHAAPRPLSEDLRRWRESDSDKSLGSLVEAFGPTSFAVLFVVLLGLPALPIPTGGVTNVAEVVAIVVAFQLLLGRSEVWLPQRWCRISMTGDRRNTFIDRLIGLIARLERHSHPRARLLFGNRAGNVVFAALVIVGTTASAVAPPFSGLDTLPALGVVLLSVGVLLQDVVVAVAGVLVEAIGILVLVIAGRAAFNAVEDLVSTVVLVPSPL